MFLVAVVALVPILVEALAPVPARVVVPALPPVSPLRPRRSLLLPLAVAPVAAVGQPAQLSAVVVLQVLAFPALRLSWQGVAVQPSGMPQRFPWAVVEVVLWQQEQPQIREIVM